MLSLLEGENNTTPAPRGPGAQVPAGPRQIDLHRLELRFAATRIANVAAVRLLTESIRERGQLVPCVAAGAADGGALVLIDGYRRVGALVRVGADTALLQCWHCPVGQALAQLLAQSRSRSFDPIEEALLLRELIDAHGLSQREAARQCARDVSWVQRRLVLLDALPRSWCRRRAARKCRAGGAARMRCAALAAQSRCQPIVHARATDLVWPLPGRPAAATRAHGGTPAPAHRQSARVCERTCGQGPARRA